MRVLVLGGNRFFGARLVKNLVTRGVGVAVLNRGRAPNPFPEEISAKIEWITLDRKELHASHPALKNRSWDVIFDQICYELSDARGACAAFAGKTKKYVFTSSQSVYTGVGAEIPESTFQPEKFALSEEVLREKNYALAKQQCEAVFAREAPFEVTSVRFPIVLGEDDYTKRLEFHIHRIRDGKPIFFPNRSARISFIHAGDAAGFLASLLEKNSPGPINVCAKDPITIGDLIDKIERSVGRKALLAGSAQEGDASPFGIEWDWFMSTEKLRSYGYEASPILDWLPGLISRA